MSRLTNAIAEKILIPASRQLLRRSPVRRDAIWGWIHRNLYWRHFEAIAQTEWGGRFHIQFPSAIHVYTYYFGVWEPNITAFLDRTIRLGDVVIDVGANIGLHTIFAAKKVGASGRVIAIEASPEIFRQLNANIALNAARNVTAINAAATERRGKVKIHFAAGDPGRSTIIESTAEQYGAPVEAEVDGAPLSDLVGLEILRRARLIKIDVEGAEWLVITGMADALPLLSSDCIILLEVTPFALSSMGHSVQDLLTLFSRAGFVARAIENSYDAVAYIRREITEPGPLLEQFELADLVFMRR